MLADKEKKLIPIFTTFLFQLLKVFVCFSPFVYVLKTVL